MKPKDALKTQITINTQQYQQLCELRAINRRYGLMIDHLMENI